VSTPAGTATTTARDWSRMYQAMVGLGVLCAAIVVGVFLATQGRIAANRRRALEVAIRDVLPGTAHFETYVGAADGRIRKSSAAADPQTGPRIHAAYSASGTLIGVAVEARGIGYQDLISVLYAYTIEDHAIVGLRVLESRETPGLGDRIESDPEFLENFSQLDVRLREDGVELLHPIVAVRHGEKQNDWEIDGITGATISTHAIADLLQQSTSYWIPKLEAQWNVFERAE